MTGWCSEGGWTWAVAEAGIDTVSVAYAPEDDVRDAFRALGPQTRRRETDWTCKPPRSEWDGRFLPGYFSGMRLGYYPRARLLVAEGRLSAICAGTSADRRLAPAHLLPQAASRAADVFRALLGTPFESSDFTVRRCDVASEIRFADPEQGRRFLSGCAAGLHIQRLIRVVPMRRDGIEPDGVYWETSRGIGVRVYDAGERHGTDERGHLIRLELQIRRQGRDRSQPEALNAELPDLCRRRFRGWVERAPVVHTTGPEEAVRRVRELAYAGELKLARAARLCGDIAIFADGEDRRFYGERTRIRRLNEIRGLGEHFERWTGRTERSFDLGPPLRALVSAQQTA